MTDSSYQWKANNTNISNQKSYTLTNNEIGKNITLTISYVDGEGFNQTIVSNSINNIQPVNDGSATVQINGSNVVGELLTSNITVNDPDGNGNLLTDASYQWKANNTNISTQKSYTLTNNEIGKNITLTINYVDGEGFNQTIVSNSINNIQPVDDGSAKVQISGNNVVGQLLTASIILDDPDGNGNLLTDSSYQWKANNTLISTQNSYTLTNNEIGMNITLTISYVDGEGFNQTIVSNSINNIQPVNDGSAKVQISGDVIVGELLIANIITNDPDGNGNLFTNASYQWKANNVNIQSGTNEFYTLQENDLGKTITVSISYVDSEGFTENIISSPTSPIQRPPTTINSISLDEENCILNVNISNPKFSNDLLLLYPVGVTPSTNVNPSAYVSVDTDNLGDHIVNLSYEDLEGNFQLYYAFNNGEDGLLEIEDPFIIDISLPVFTVIINSEPEEINDHTKISFNITSSRNGEVALVGSPKDVYDEDNLSTVFIALNSSNNNNIKKNVPTTFTVDNPILKYTNVSFKSLFIVVKDRNDVDFINKISNYSISSSSISQQNNFSSIGNSVSSILDDYYWNFDSIKQKNNGKIYYCLNGSSKTYENMNGLKNYQEFSNKSKEMINYVFNHLSEIIPYSFELHPKNDSDILLAYKESIFDINYIDDLFITEVLGDTPDFFGIAGFPGTYESLFSRGGCVFISKERVPQQSYGSNFVQTLIHELGHALGLTHPHHKSNITENNLTIMPGVSSSSDYGTYNSNQILYTAMSYQTLEYHALSDDYGMPFTFMALDIAALQFLYGSKPNKTGNNIYYLTSTHTVEENGLVSDQGVNSMCIYDTSGNDTISSAGENNPVIINLNNADLGDVEVNLKDIPSSYYNIKQSGVNFIIQNLNPIPGSEEEAILLNLLDKPLTLELLKDIKDSLEEENIIMSNDEIIQYFLDNDYVMRPGFDVIQTNTSGGYLSSIPSLTGSGFTISGNLTQIENAIGGNKNDVIFENDTSNVIDGGDGNGDLVVFLGNHNNYKIKLNYDNVTVSVNHKSTNETDSLTNIEYIKFNNSNEVSINSLFTNLEYQGLDIYNWFDLSGVTINQLNSVNLEVSKRNKSKIRMKRSHRYSGSCGVNNKKIKKKNNVKYLTNVKRFEFLKRFKLLLKKE